jgi:crotonobetainyl-CoA:carnitine CoA-transferase CaiB-like acyl-CoA transferase
VQNRASLIQKLQDVFLTKTYEEWVQLLLAQGIPMGAINTMDQVVKHPQVQARGMIIESEYPVAGKVKIVGVPAAIPAEPPSPAITGSAALAFRTP